MDANNKPKKALIAMSGGVDSSVAALLTVRAGYDCIGCTMQLHDESDEPVEGTCCTTADAEDARAVAFRLGMPYYVFNFKDDFRKTVIGDFIDCYEHGRTPNPCIECNRKMKFDKLYERAKILSCDKIVTGHYARVVFEDGRYKLKKALDPKKDQSYVLYCLTQEQLAHTLFPLGGMTKDQTRAVAAEAGFYNARKKDSQDLCFVPDGNYARAIEKFTGKKPQPGDFVDRSGKVLGRHKGIIFYTVGQHKGLGIVSETPYYVLKIDAAKNEILLGSNEDLFTKTAFVRDLHLITGEDPAGPFEASVKIRYRHPEQPATVTPLGGGRAMIVFDEPQRAITPGQAAVMYRGDEVLGGGVIE